VPPASTIPAKLSQDEQVNQPNVFPEVVQAIVQSEAEKQKEKSVEAK